MSLGEVLCERVRRFCGRGCEAVQKLHLRDMIGESLSDTFDPLPLLSGPSLLRGPKLFLNPLFAVFSGRLPDSLVHVCEFIPLCVGLKEVPLSDEVPSVLCDSCLSGFLCDLWDEVIVGAQDPVFELLPVFLNAQVGKGL